MTAETTLERAFNAYLNLAIAELRPRVKPQSQRIQLLETRSMELLRLVAEIESSPQFSELVDATAMKFPRASDVHHLRGGEEVPVQRIDIENFFRRSRCYLSLQSGEEIDANSCLRNLIAEFRKERIQVRRLVPLRYIQFNAEAIEFDNFQIRRFSVEELSEIFQNDVRSVFYQGHTVDVGEIAEYWFIDCLELVESASYHTWRLHFGVESGLPVTREISAFPGVVARILEPLILYDWESASILDYDSNPFDVPFVLETADDLLRAPRSVPEIPTFEMVVLPDEDGEDVFDPIIKVDMDDPTLASFHAFVTVTDSILTRLRSAKGEWHFLEVALLFLSRAFFSEGLQQLLWHITALEALLGEKKESQGLTNLIANRLASSLGTEQERKQITKSFKALYDLRSRLVHGDEELLDQKTHKTHLREARNLARRTLVWFLHYCDHVIHESRHDQALPTREELLSVLDLKTESRERVKRLLEILPVDFPHKPDWLDN